MAKNEHLSTIKELDAAYEDKRPVRYGYRQDLSDADKANYAKRKQAIENRLNSSIPKLENEKVVLEQKRISILNDPRFIFVDRSYFVNLDYAKELCGDSIIMLNGEALPVSRPMMPKVKEAILSLWGDGLVK